VISTPSKDGGTTVAVASGRRVAGMLVAETGTWVGASVTWIAVFVDRGSGLAGVLTFTDMSHPTEAKINMERNNKVLFNKVLYMMDLLSYPSIHIRNKKLPRRWESLDCPDGQALRCKDVFSGVAKEKVYLSLNPS
jgi:hypothetical protein